MFFCSSYDIIVSYFVNNSMDRVSVIWKLASKWYPMRMCASWLCPFKLVTVICSKMNLDGIFFQVSRVTNVAELSESAPAKKGPLGNAINLAKGRKTAHQIRLILTVFFSLGKTNKQTNKKANREVNHILWKRFTDPHRRWLELFF